MQRLQAVKARGKHALWVGMALTALVLLAGRQPAPASAHNIIADCVGDASDIRWLSTTKYTAERDYAMNQWESLDQKLDFIGPTTYFNMLIVDVNRKDVVWAGQYQNKGGASCSIKLNTFFVDSFSANQRKNVMLHELGHSLGMGHSFPGQVMNKFVSSVTSPQSHDKDDFKVAKIFW